MLREPHRFKAALFTGAGQLVRTDGIIRSKHQNTEFHTSSFLYYVWRPLSVHEAIGGWHPSHWDWLSFWEVGNSERAMTEGRPPLGWTTLVAIRMSAAVSFASTALPLLVLRARRGK